MRLQKLKRERQLRRAQTVPAESTSGSTGEIQVGLLLIEGPSVKGISVLIWPWHPHFSEFAVIWPAYRLVIVSETLLHAYMYVLI